MRNNVLYLSRGEKARALCEAITELQGVTNNPQPNPSGMKAYLQDLIYQPSWQGQLKSITLVTIFFSLSPSRVRQYDFPQLSRGCRYSIHWLGGWQNFEIKGGGAADVSSPLAQRESYFGFLGLVIFISVNG